MPFPYIEKSPACMRDSFFANYLIRLRAAEQADDEEQDDRTSDGDQDTGQVETCHSLGTEQTHDPAAQNCADDANDDVGQRTHLFICPHDHARNPTCESAEDDPYKPVHFYLHGK